MAYLKDIYQLQEQAVIWWPAELSKTQVEGSIIPRLIETRGKFVSLLKLSGSHPYDIFELAQKAAFPANLLIKHLAVLTDVGGEGLKRIGSEFSNIFPFDSSSNSHFFDFTWGQEVRRHYFKSLPLRSGQLSNTRLGLDGTGLVKPIELSELHIDTAMILMFAGLNTDEAAAEKSDFYKCIVGSLLGDEYSIDKYVEERYIWVSRITGGATANDLGQIAQNWVYEQLITKLGAGFSVVKNGKTLVSGEGITSDILVSNRQGQVGIEVSFQVTTNSTIERKGNEAENRQRLMHSSGNYVAYIIDGAGNFERKSAVTKICNNSDCTVAFSEAEIEVLVKFIKEKLD